MPIWSNINIFIQALKEDKPRIRRNTDETYSLDVQYKDQELVPYIDVGIGAMTYFGARHALETLSQLWGFDDGFGGIISPSFIILDDVIIDNDGPEFPHRGVLIDTCRNYIDKVYPNLFLQHMVQNRFKVV